MKASVIFNDRMARPHQIDYEDINIIITDRARQFSDLDGNGINPDTVVMRFYFRDGSIATFDAIDTEIIFHQ